MSREEYLNYLYAVIKREGIIRGKWYSYYAMKRENNKMGIAMVYSSHYQDTVCGWLENKDINWIEKVYKNYTYSLT